MTLGERYDAIADRYRRWWAPVLESAALGTLDDLTPVVRANPTARILDLGTGTGTLAAGALARWPGVRVVGLDSSRGMLALAEAAVRDRVGAATAEARFETVHADAAEIPLPDASVDAVMSSFVLQLVDARRALAGSLRALRPGGRLAIVTWVGPDAPFEPDLALDDALDELEIELPDDEDEEDDSPGHFERPEHLAELVRDAGFVDVRAREAALEYGFDPATYGEFLAEYGERALFESIAPDDARALRELTERYLAELPARAFRWRTPLVRVTAQRPEA